jgi:hypothetical protein
MCEPVLGFGTLRSQVARASARGRQQSEPALDRIQPTSVFGGKRIKPCVLGASAGRQILYAGSARRVHARDLASLVQQRNVTLRKLLAPDAIERRGHELMAQGRAGCTFSAGPMRTATCSRLCEFTGLVPAGRSNGGAATRAGRRSARRAGCTCERDIGGAQRGSDCAAGLMDSPDRRPGRVGSSAIVGSG